MAFERVGVEAVVEGLSKFQAGIRSINDGLRTTASSAEVAEKRTDLLNKSMTAVGAGMVAAGAATGALIFSSVRLAARVETLGVVVGRLGENIGLTREETDAYVESIREQGITLQASRSAFARMVQSQIDVAAGAKLATLAQDAAVIANVNSSEAFERLVFTITSGNVRMARTLGLQVSFQQAYEDLATQLGITTLELTQQQKVQARTTAVLAAGATITGTYAEAMTTAGKKVLSLDRHLEESRRIMGEAWLPVFAEAVDVVTSLLKSWQDLSEGQQQAISIFLGVAAVVGVVAGAMLIAVPQVIAFTAALAAAEIALAPLLISLGLVALAIGVVAVAGVKLLAFLKDTDEGAKETTKSLNEYHQELIRGSMTQEEYEAEVARLNQVLEDNGFWAKALFDDLVPLTEEQRRLAKETAEADARMIAAGQAFQDMQDPARIAARAEADVAREAENVAKAEEEAAIQTKILAQDLSDLNSIVDGKLTENVEDFRETIEDLEGQLDDLPEEKLARIAELEIDNAEEVARAQERRAKLRNDEKILLAQIEERNESAEENDKERSTAQILREKQRLAAIRGGIVEQTTIIEDSAGSQAEALAALDVEFAESEAAIREEIDETTKAFDDQTKRIIFDMFQQRLAIDGFTKEELKVLRKLAGPDGFGILDEAQAALLEQLDTLATDLEKPGDQSDIVSGQLEGLFGVISDGTIAVDDLDRALSNIKPLNLVAVRTAQGQEIFIPANLVGAFVAGGRNSATGQALATGQAADAPTPEPLSPSGPQEGDSFSMEVNTVAPAEDIVSDFQMMRAQSERNRGGFIE